MGPSLVLKKIDRALLFFLLAVFIFIVLLASFFLPVIYLAVAFNAIFIFMLFFYLMLFLDNPKIGCAMEPKTFPSVSVVIPMYNSINTIKKCIESIKKINYPKKIRIIVVDDASTDGSRELVEKMKGVELIKMKHNVGRSGAINAGLKKTLSEFVITIDSDSYPERDVLLKSMGYFEDNKIVAVTALVLPDKKDTFVRKIQHLEYAITFGMGNALFASIGSSYVTPGPFTIFRRKLFDRIGFFEEGNLAEDMELGLRIKAHSMKIMTCRDALVLTDAPSGWRGLFIQRNRWYRGGAFNFLKHKSLFFNKKNMHFGFFVMPFLFATQLLVIAVLVRTVLFFLNDLFSTSLLWASYFYLGGKVVAEIPPNVLPLSLLFFLASYILIATYFFISLFSVHYKFNRKDFFPLIILIFIYPYFLGFVNSQSYFKELLGVKGKWQRVST